MLWIKPNGKEIEVNDSEETTEYVKTLGWKVKGAKVEAKEEPKKVAKKKTAKKSK